MAMVRRKGCLGLLMSFPSSHIEELSAQRLADKRPEGWFDITANLVNEAVRFRKNTSSRFSLGFSVCKVT